jgi:hypothetical protein
MKPKILTYLILLAVFSIISGKVGWTQIEYFTPVTVSSQETSKELSDTQVPEALVRRFEYLSKNGNSSCSLSFLNSIPAMPDTARLQGSCCSPMNLHHYSEQIEGLKKYSSIPEIPSDPYDIEVKLAKKLLTSDRNIRLTSEEQTAYDYAMQHSDEGGPCCCKCWRWYVYSGLGKYLIRNYKFTGEQVTEVWNLSDGCGGGGKSGGHHH